MAINTEKIKAIIGTEEMKNYKVLLRQLFAEFLGTFLYLALISLSIFPELTASLTTAMSNGLVVGSVIQIIGHVSGGHINPAVTFGVLVTDQIKVLRALCYVVAQILGAIAGTLLSSATMNKYSDISDVPEDSIVYNNRNPDVRVLKVREPDVRIPNVRIRNASLEIEQLKDYQILLLEFLMSFTLVLVVLSVVDTKRGARGLGSAALAIGLCLAACQCSCQFYPAILNPAVAIGFAVVFDVLTDHWVYLLGPILGGICAGLIYRFVFTIKLRSLSDS